MNARRPDAASSRHSLAVLVLLSTFALLLPATVASRTIRVDGPNPYPRSSQPSLPDAPHARANAVTDSARVDSIAYRLSVPAASFVFGDTVAIRYTITNESAQAESFLFGTSCQWSVQIHTEGCTPDDAACTAHQGLPVGCFFAPSQFALDPGESRTFSMDWRQHAKDGFPLSPGAYRVFAALLDTHYEESALDVGFTIEPSGPRVIQSALDGAAQGDTVLVAPGVYDEWIELRAAHDGVVLLSESGPQVTILDGGRRGSVIYAAGVTGATVVEGFTLRNGLNAREDGGDWEAGGGMSVLFHARPSVRRNIFRDNEAPQGGGMNVSGYQAGAFVERNLFVGNEAGWSGGAVATSSSTIVLLANNTFVDNRAGSLGGAVYTGYGGGATRNNIFFRNTAGVSGGALYRVSTQTIDACNAYWMNGPDDMGGAGSPDDPVFADPLFCDADAGDYRLRADSPCGPEGPTGCGLIGAFEVGCSAVGVPDAYNVRPPLLRVSPAPFGRELDVRVHAARALERPGTEPFGDGGARLEIFDATGRRVWSASVPADGFKRWDGRMQNGRSVADGVYFIRLLRGDRVLGTTKVVRAR